MSPEKRSPRKSKRQRQARSKAKRRRSAKHAGANEGEVAGFESEVAETLIREGAAERWTEEDSPDQATAMRQKREVETADLAAKRAAVDQRLTDEAKRQGDTRKAARLQRAADKRLRSGERRRGGARESAAVDGYDSERCTPGTVEQGTGADNVGGVQVAALDRLQRGTSLSLPLLEAIKDGALRPRPGEKRSSGGFYLDATVEDHAIWKRIALEALPYPLAPYQAVEAVKREISLRDAAKYQEVVAIRPDGLFALWSGRVATDAELEEEVELEIDRLRDAERADRDALARERARRSMEQKDFLLGRRHLRDGNTAPSRQAPSGRERIEKIIRRKQRGATQAGDEADEAQRIAKKIPDGAHPLVHEIAALGDSVSVGRSGFKSCSDTTVRKYLPILQRHRIINLHPRQKRSNIMRGPMATAGSAALRTSD